jgi:hypothetical protein
MFDEHDLNGRIHLVLGDEEKPTFVNVITGVHAGERPLFRLGEIMLLI